MRAKQEPIPSVQETKEYKNKTTNPEGFEEFLRDFIGIEEFFLSLGGKCVSGS